MRPIRSLVLACVAPIVIACSQAPRPAAPPAPAADVAREVTHAAAPSPAGPARLWVDERAPVSDDAGEPAEATTPAEIVIQSMHVGAVASAAVHPGGRAVAFLSMDNPDEGQTLEPPVPYVHLTLLDERTGEARLTYRGASRDFEDPGLVSFGGDDRLIVAGAHLRSWDLRTGAYVEDPLGPGYYVTGARGDVFVRTYIPYDAPACARVEIGGVGAARRLALEADGSVIGLHPFEDRILTFEGGCYRLRSTDGARLRGSGCNVADYVLPPRFRPGGGALYVPGDASIAVLHPRTLERIGAIPSARSFVALDDAGRHALVDAASGAGHVVIDLSNGAKLATVARPTDVDEEGDLAAGFTRNGADLWLFREVSMPIDDAKREVAAAWRRRDRSVETIPAFRIERVDPSTGTSTVTATLPRMPDEYVRGRGAFAQVAPIDEGHAFVTRSQRVFHFDAATAAAEPVPQRVVEAILTDAIVNDDTVALGGPISVGVLSPSGASAVACPNLPGATTALRFDGATAHGYASRFVCHPATARRDRHDAVLGASEDGSLVAVAVGDVAFESTAAIRVLHTRTGRTTRIRGADVAGCHVDGCFPDVTFVHGDEYALVGRDLYDLRTGRPTGLSGALVDPTGRWLVDEESPYGDPTSTLSVVDLRTRTTVTSAVPIDGEIGSTGEESPRVDPVFADDGSAIAFVRWTEAETVLEVRALPSLALLGAMSIAHAPTVIRFYGPDRVAVVLDDCGEREVRLHHAVGLAPAGPPIRSRSELALADDGPRAASCDGGRLAIGDLVTGARTTTGRCSGRVRRLDARYAIALDGSQARIVRLDDGRTLRVRMFLDETERMSLVADDERGAWWAAPVAFPHLRHRAAGHVLTAALTTVYPGTSGYDARLVQRFFAAAGARPAAR